MRSPLLVLIVSSLCANAAAQDTAFSVALSDSIVVTASRLPEEVRQTGRRVVVITASDVQSLPGASLDDVLRTVGGVELQSRGGFGVQSDITMRGSSFDGVVILLDGARLNDPQTGHFLTNLPVPLSEIARIEVVRGPSVALYGPDAVGGVIHLFTWSGLQQRAALPAGALDVQVGRHGFYSLGGAVRAPFGRTHLSLSSAFSKADGEPILDDAGRPIRSSRGDVRTDFRRHVHSLALTRGIGSTDLLIRGGLDGRDFGSWHYYTPFASDTARSDSRTAWAQVRLLSSRPAAKTRMSGHLSFRTQESSYTYNPASSPNSHTNHLGTLQTEVRHQVSAQLSLGGGVLASVRGIDSNSMGEHRDVGGGAFALIRWQPASSFTFNGSTRLDHDAAFGTELIPQISMAFDAGVIVWRGAAARAVRAPTYTERYYDTERENPTGNLGNPDLRAERAWTLETGADVYAGDLSLHATVFIRRARDVIDYVRVDGVEPLFVARNMHAVDTDGVELDAVFARSLGDTRLRATASVTLLDSQLDVPDGLSFKYALTHARRIAQASMTGAHGPASVGVRAMWKDPIAAEAFGVIDVRATWQLPVGGDRISAVAELRNVFDRHYAEVFDAPMPGRWWIVGLRIR